MDPRDRGRRDRLDRRRRDRLDRDRRGRLDREGARRGTPERGFTLLELVIVVAVVGILATAALPLTRWSVKRSKEVELQQALRQIRDALDAYHQAAVSGLIEVEAGEPGYPPDLETLVEGVEVVITETDEDLRALPPRQLKFLRRIPVDPMTGEAEWGRRCYDSEPDASFWCGEDVYDVFSKSDATAIDGSRYSDW